MTHKTGIQKQEIVESKNTIISINPSTGEELGRVDTIGCSEIDIQIAKAREAYSSWSNVPIKERQQYLKRLFRGRLENIQIMSLFR